MHTAPEVCVKCARSSQNAGFCVFFTKFSWGTSPGPPTNKAFGRANLWSYHFQKPSYAPVQYAANMTLAHHDLTAKIRAFSSLWILRSFDSVLSSASLLRSRQLMTYAEFSDSDIIDGFWTTSSYEANAHTRTHTHAHTHTHIHTSLTPTYDLVDSWLLPSNTARGPV